MALRKWAYFFGAFPNLYYFISSKLANLLTSNIGPYYWTIVCPKCSQTKENVKNGILGGPMCYFFYEGVTKPPSIRPERFITRSGWEGKGRQTQQQLMPSLLQDIVDVCSTPQLDPKWRRMVEKVCQTSCHPRSQTLLFYPQQVVSDNN